MYNDERAFVRTHSGRACVQCLWADRPRRWRVGNAFPRRRVGTRNNVQNQLFKYLCITMSVGTWERDKSAICACGVLRCALCVWLQTSLRKELQCLS